MAAQRTLRELATPNVNQQPLCITYTDTEEAFELKSGLIHLLSTFRGIADKAKDWLFYLPSGSITTWEVLKRQILEKFFPTSRAANIRKEIYRVRQANGEILYEYWERFKQLCASCPHHQIHDQLLIQYFYEGLLPMDRSMVDAASGGALVNKTTDEAKRLISNMTENSQQFGVKSEGVTRRVNKVNHSDLVNRLTELTALVRQMAKGQVQAAKACEISAAPEHMTDICPTLQEDPHEQANAMGGLPGPPQWRNDPYAPTYNPGWRNHPNFSYAQKPSGFKQPFQQRQLVQQPSTSDSGMSLKDMVKSLADSTCQMRQDQQRFQQDSQRFQQDQQRFQQETRASIRTLEAQMSQLASSLSNFENSKRKLPTQVIPNPMENVSAITLRSGKELQEYQNAVSKHDLEEQVEEETMKSPTQSLPRKEPRDEPPVVVTPPPPFSSRYAKSRKEEQEQKVFDIFRKVELKGFEKIYMGENVSAVLQQKLPFKHKDPGMFTVPCKIENVKVENALIDLGAAINIMPRSIYNSLNFGSLKETSAIMQLADMSNAYPDRILEDIPVQVDKLVFLADFYVLDMDDDLSVSPLVLLGRLFLMTSKTKIDVYSGTLTMEFDGDIIKFNTCDAIKCSSEAHSIFVIDVIDPFMQQKFELNGRDALKVVINCNFDSHKMSRVAKKFELHPD
ncbi:uncharacterized protein LOC113759592 [Coffea eugenioides]|uniref:uncharacterized protein LOC113759592 n=1 Tax=Coffea eugenioides TaxID=49369 RepID=UPI000F610B31|nr:uncharacterized protein LOC113759592 [Coffea eugenioides]